MIIQTLPPKNSLFSSLIFLRQVFQRTEPQVLGLHCVVGRPELRILELRSSALANASEKPEGLAL